ELADKVDGANILVVAEGEPDIPQQLDAHGTVLRVARDGEGGLTSQLRPFPASKVRNGQKRPPVVGGAVVERLGNLGVGVDELVEVVDCPAGGTAAQRSKPFVVTPPQARNRRTRPLALELHDDRAVLERVSQGTNGGNRLRSPGREPARLVFAIKFDV